MNSIFLNLSTRHGIRGLKTKFNSFKWFLPDPIVAPSSDYTLNISVKFIVLPDKHKRINFQRGTNLLLVERKNRSTGEIVELSIVVTAGSYTNQGFLDAINQKIIDTDQQPVSLQLSFARNANETLDEEMYAGIELENIILRTANVEFDYRIIHDGIHNASECLGIHDTTGWVSATDPDGVQIANSVMDTYGTRTITIEANGLSSNNADVVDRFRRKCCLLTIPCDTTDMYKMMIWEREGSYRDGNPIGHRCLTGIELSLTDDMGLEFDPRHHWTIGLEVYATPVKHFTYLM